MRRRKQKYHAERDLRQKFAFLRLLLWTLGLVLLGRLFYLQLIEGERYRSISENNYIRDIVLRSSRGLLLDRDGRSLCRNRVSFSLVMDLSRGRDVEGTIELLREDLGFTISPEEIETAFRQSPVASEAVLARDIPLSWVERVEVRQEQWRMLRIEMELRREYPYGKRAAHAIGYVGLLSPEEAKRLRVRNADIFQEVGKAGAERSANPALMGSNGLKIAFVDNLGREVESLDLRLPGGGIVEEPVPGRDTHLNLDMELQTILEDAFGGESGVAVFMNPQSGEILSFVSRPSFDPNLFSGSMTRARWRRLTEDPLHPLLNRPIQGTYPTGSLMKPFVALVGLQEGVLTMDREIRCTGSIEVGDHVFHCWNRGGHGPVRLAEALQNSCNVFFYKTGEELGIGKLRRWASRTGLAARTGIDLPGERVGIFPSPAWKEEAELGPWYPGDTLNVCIGQGYLTVTPMQMLSMYAMIASRGKRYRPRVIRGPSEVLEVISFSPESIEAIVEGLWRTVNAEGTGVRCALPGLDVCAKTGTAQVVRNRPGADQSQLEKSKRDHSWVAGFAPRERPRVAFVVLVEHGGKGGDEAARIAHEGLKAFFYETKAEPPETPTYGEDALMALRED